MKVALFCLLFFEGQNSNQFQEQLPFLKYAKFSLLSRLGSALAKSRTSCYYIQSDCKIHIRERLDNGKQDLTSISARYKYEV